MTSAYTPASFTMDELKDMDAQDVFNNCAQHLFRQGRQSQLCEGDEMRQCLYRGAGGAMCAIGLFIPETLYNPRMDKENLYVGDLAHPGSLYDNWIDKHLHLLLALQRVHDSTTPWDTTQTMQHSLRRVATQMELNPVTLNTLWFADR